MILCSNGVFDATCHKHIFWDSLSHFLCSLTQGLAIFWFCMFLFAATTIVGATQTETSLLKQHVAGECVGLLDELQSCCN